MKKVDLSEQAFNSVGITFAGKHYKLFHGDDNTNDALQMAFPQYFERAKHTDQAPKIYDTSIEQGTSIKQDSENTPEPKAFLIEPVEEPLSLNAVKDYVYPNLEDKVYDVINLDEAMDAVNTEEAMEGLLPIEPKSILTEKETLALNELFPDIEPVQAPEVMIAPSKTFDEHVKGVFSVLSSAVSGVLYFVMSLRFIVMTAMLMIAFSAISFDIDGWKETYHRLAPEQVTFIIISLYVAKMAIIKILSVSVVKEKISSIWQDKVAFYFSHYLLKSILVASLLGMVFVSSAGIYSSLAVSTVGDAKTIALGDSRIAFIDKQILTTKNRILSMRDMMPEVQENINLQLQALDSSIASIRDKIKNTSVRIADLPKNYKTAKRNLQIQINRMNNEISTVQERKTTIISSKAGKIEGINKKIEVLQDKINIFEDKKEQAKIELNVMSTENTNKALNFTAELLGVELLSLLKFINLLMTFVLEITYLSLTWYSVRLGSYTDINKNKEESL